MRISELHTKSVVTLKVETTDFSSRNRKGAKKDLDIHLIPDSGQSEVQFKYTPQNLRSPIEWRKTEEAKREKDENKIREKSEPNRKLRYRTKKKTIESKLERANRTFISIWSADSADQSQRDERSFERIRKKGWRKIEREREIRVRVNAKSSDECDEERRLKYGIGTRKSESKQWISE